MVLCVTRTVLPAIVRFASRAAPALAVTATVTVPAPLPDAGVADANAAWLAVQEFGEQSAGVTDTCTVFESAPGPKSRVSGATANVHGETGGVVGPSSFPLSAKMAAAAAPPPAIGMMYFNLLPPFGGGG